ncbi:MAG: hypothetical protein EKK64_06530 [Neisseriaceae bacterium]|jgi:hypothetical protein|nr:MAG: hypothetical protein EKK64_06530 [Neisseriaceae bacterium]
MDIEANWEQICDCCSKESPDMEILYDLANEGLLWLKRGGFPPKLFGGNTKLAIDIYQSLRSIASDCTLIVA